MDPWLRHSYQIWNNLIKEHLAGFDASLNPLAFQCYSPHHGLFTTCKKKNSFSSRASIITVSSRTILVARLRDITGACSDTSNPSQRPSITVSRAFNSDGKHQKMGLVTDYPLPTCTDQSRISRPRVPRHPIVNRDQCLPR